MEYRELGKTGIKVSRLCFGALVIGPLQADLSTDVGAEVIRHAFDAGVNFIDTAEIYGTYPYIRQALKKERGDVVVSTKSYAYSSEGARDSFEKARKEMDIDVIDIFMLHEQVSELTLKGHREALEYYIEMKHKGKIRAVGVSTHHIEVVRAASAMPEIDIIHPLFNIDGLGICDGTMAEMADAIKNAHNNGKGIYSMKALGGGNLLRKYSEGLRFVIDNLDIDSVAVGMKTIEEVEMNLRFFTQDTVNSVEVFRPDISLKQLHIEYWCVGCGKCIERCSSGALSVSGGKAVADHSRCLRCGYCSRVCDEFAIKIK